jgi:hypothetical protein
MVWSVFTDEAALQRWEPAGSPYALVPARDVLWTAQRNGMILAINPSNPEETRVSLDHEEISALSEGRYPRAVGDEKLVSGAEIAVLPLDEPLEEATRDSIKRALVAEPMVSRAYAFKARFGYQQLILALGIEFDPEVDQEVRNEVCERMKSRGQIVLKDATPIGFLPMWEAIADVVTKEGVKVYDRTESAPLGYVTVPEGHEVTLSEPSPTSRIWRTVSGIWFVDFGPDTLDDPKFFESIREFLAEEEASSVLWVIQGSAVSNFLMSPESLQRWVRNLHQLLHIQVAGVEKRHHTFVVKAESEAQRAFVYILLAFGVSVYQTGPNGELLVEIRGPQGVTVGMPGPSCEPLAPEQRFVLKANEEKDRLAASGGAELTDIEQQERQALARVLAAPPELHWQSGSSEAVA